MTQHVAPLDWGSAFTSWQLSPWDALVVLLAVPYLLGVRACRRDGRSWPVGRTACYAGGLAAMVIAINSAVSVYSDDLFWIHMVQHLTLIMAVPVLLILGRPLTLWVLAGSEEQAERRRGLLNARATGLVTNPALTFVLYAVVLVLTHLTPFLEVRLQHPALEHAEIFLYLFSGYLFFLPVIGVEPIRWQRLPHPLRVVLLLVGMMPDTLVGVVLMIAARPVAPSFALANAGWGPPLLHDQALAGSIMWFFGDATMAALALLAVRNWLRSSGSEAGFGTWLEAARRQALTGQETGSEAARLGSSADVDSDEQALDAYNAMLARLNNPSRDQSGHHQTGHHQTGHDQSSQSQPSRDQREDS